MDTLRFLTHCRCFPSGKEGALSAADCAKPGEAMEQTNIKTTRSVTLDHP